MTEKQSKLRQQAEIAFAKAQGGTQPGARVKSRAVEEIDLMVQARNEKTMALKQARIAKEAEDQARTAATAAAKKHAKP
jgi:hypothetical protein